MSNPYYTPSSNPGYGSPGASSPVRAEFLSIANGFALLPTLSGLGSTAVVVNPSGTGLTNTTGTLALAGNFATTGAYALTLAVQAAVTLTLPAVNGTLATLAGTETLTNKTLTAPALTGATVDTINGTAIPSGQTLVYQGGALGTPASGVLTNCTGTASGLNIGGLAATATNIAGGLGGSIPYQTGVATTAMLANGSARALLVSAGGTSAPAWTTETWAAPGTSGNVLTSNGTNWTATAPAAAAAGTLTGTTLASGVTTSSLTSFGASIALGTPASGVLTNCTGTASGLTAGAVPASGITGTTLAASVTTSSLTSFGASIALGTPASATLTNATGLPVATGVSGLGTGVATALASAVNTAGGMVTYGTDLHLTGGTVSGATTFSASGTALTVTNNATVGALAVTGAATVGTTLGVTGAATVGGTLAVTGGTAITGALTVGGYVSSLSNGGSAFVFTNAVGLTLTQGSTASTGISLEIEVVNTASYLAVFNYIASGVGSISTNGASVSYNTASDYRLKNTFGAFDPGDMFDRLTVHDVEFKKNPGVRIPAFLAHELQAVIPHVVNGTKDAVKPDGSIVPQMVDHSGLVPWMCAEIITLRRRIATQERR